MSESLLQQLIDLLRGAFLLEQEAFQTVARLSTGRTIATLVVLFAGLSLGIGQSIILFANQVKPIRFILSLLLNAILFVFGFFFLVFSTWLIGLLPGVVRVSSTDLFRALGLSYAPLLFSFLGAMPYAGVPILNVLSVWHLLAMVIGVGAIASTSLGNAFTLVAFGWFTLQLLKGSIGRPISQLGQRLSRKVAGVELVRDRSQLKELIQSGREPRSPQPETTPANGATPVVTTGRSPNTVAEPTEAIAAFSNTAALQLPRTEASTLSARLAHRFQGVPQLLRLGLLLFGMILLFILVAILLQPIRSTLFSWQASLPWWGRRIFDLTWIGIVALIFAGLLAPVEALGWWAGWYGDEVDTQQVTPVAPPAGQQSDSGISRYMVYLDGVGQSGEAYTPDVVDFIEALQPVLPDDIAFVQGLMLYSVRNKSLRENRPLAWVWRLADSMRWENPMALLGLMVNLRNAWIVAVSADKRYGPIFNQGIAQVIYNGLVKQGYQPGSGTPITLIGYSGGAQLSIAAAPYVYRALGGDIEVISLGGVMSGNINLFNLSHLYHLVGDKDGVAGFGPMLFPGRRKFFPLSYWNRALRKGKISEISLGPMGHQVPGGIMDPNAYLPSGESHLQHTIALILSILNGNLLAAAPPRPRQTSNFSLYKQAPFNDYSYYPLSQTVNPRYYQPIAPWIGRLILPKLPERKHLRGVWFEVHHAPEGYESLIGQTVMLRWMNLPAVKRWVKAVTHDLHFSVDAEYSSQYGGSIHPDRLNHWQQVGPLESLAGSHPTDDMVVLLRGEVEVEQQNGNTTLYICHQPAEVSGIYYGLVQFEAPIAGTDRFQVKHFNAASRSFDGGTEIVRLPQVVQAECYGSVPSTSQGLEQSPMNETGWYVYGAKDADGCFVVRALAPRSLFRLQPDRVVFGNRASYRYIRKESWANAVEQKGRISSVLCVGHRATESNQEAIDEWKVGDRALLLHVYGGIGGNKKEPAAATPIFFGHFSYGSATVVHDPISDERRFEIEYYQVYAHNTDGITAGTHHWSSYMGDRQFGWLGIRPVCDILIKFDPFTGAFDVDGGKRSPLTAMIMQLEAMTARYRIGDGTGATFVGPANNCAQDSNQALFASIRSLLQSIEHDQPQLQTWLANNPEQVQKYEQLVDVQTQLYRKLQPLGSPRSDWEANEFNLGTTMEDDPLRNLWTGIGSWRTLLPRKSSDTIVQVFLQHGASAWVLRTNQAGGHDPDIEPISPMTI